MADSSKAYLVSKKDRRCLFSDVQLLCKRHTRHRGINLLNHFSKHLNRRIRGDHKLLSGSFVKKFIIKRSNVHLQSGDSCAEVCHLHSQLRVFLSLWEFRQGVRRYVFAHQFNPSFRTIERFFSRKTFMQLIEASEDCSNGDRRVPNSNVRLNVIRLLASNRLLSKVPIRKQNCEEGNDRRNPTAHRRNGGPVQVAFSAPLKTWSQVLEFRHRQLPLWPGRHFAMTPTSREIAT